MNYMKHFLTLLLISISLQAFAQNIISLEPVKGNETIITGESIIYGNFIQRLGFSSGGFPQDIRIVNIETNEIYAFRVKPTYKSAKENIFCSHIKPGKYYILNYWWTQSKWYGGKMYAEPIYKGVDATDRFNEKVSSGELVIEKLERFGFVISSNTINYLGTWHFDKGLVSFTNDKGALDSLMSNEFENLDYKKAEINIPD